MQFVDKRIHKWITIIMVEFAVMDEILSLLTFMLAVNS